jgi:type 1 glutamine amidotransferase
MAFITGKVAFSRAAMCQLACWLPVLCLTAMMLMPPMAKAQSVPAAAGAESFRVLVFSRTVGYRHASITNGIAAIRELGSRYGFAVDASDDSSVMTATNLARYAAVVFLSATGTVLNPDQESALKSYIEGGGGFVGIHGAVFGPLACEDKWAWYGEMFCCAFTNHSRVLPAMVNIEDGSNASTAGLPAQWQRTDEWYNYTGTPRGCARVLATVDETTYAGGKMGRDHPIAWCRRVGQGRMWYTAMGHTESSFAEPLFQKHLLGGILVAAGRTPADFSPNMPAATGFAWSREAGTLALMQTGKIVWQFNHGASASKPCFHPVAVPGGPALTWDRPPGHTWHHALWFSWKFIDGVNYWEEDAKTGKSPGRTTWREPQIETRPDFSARIVMDLSYQPTNGQPVLSEHRVAEISPPDNGGTYHQDWTMTFTAADKDVVFDRTPLPGEPGGQPWGGYAGLSVRFAKEIRDARALTPNGPVEFAGGRYRGKAAAMDYSGIFEDRDAGIAILDSAANINSPSPWYAINDGSMRYFSPAVIQDRPHRLQAGRSFTLRYRVVIHPGRWSREQLSEAADRYAAEPLSTTTENK